MVATVVGSRLGVQQTSAFVLGSRGQIGNAALGRGAESVFVNGMTGNLTLTNQDEFLIGLGPDSAINRAFNSQLATDGDNNDGWRVGARRVSVAGGVVTRTDWDGSIVTYEQLSATSYRTTEGGGSYDTLNLVSGKWIWTDGDSRITETYESDGSADGFRITKQTDTDGNSLTFAYLVSGLLSRITTQDGAYTDFAWNGSKLTDLTSTYVDAAGATKTQTRTRYAYDGQDRLVSVTVDLSPGDRMIADGKTYVTTYTYEGDSKRVNSIAQTDGSRIDITYETGGAYRVTSITQSVAQGVSRTTSYEYLSSTQTRITDPAGAVTTLTYNASGWLTKIEEPAPTAAGALRVTDIAYDAYGNVLQVKTSPTTWTNYVYDDANGDTISGDHNGLWTARHEYTSATAYVTTRRTYTALNAVQTETRYTGYTAVNPDGSPSTAVPTGAMTTRYVYDGENHLGFSLSATGEVVRHDYRADGNLISTTLYRAAYDVSALGATAVPTYSALIDWAAGLADKTAVEVTEYVYRAGTGVLDYSAVYSTILTAGNPDGGAPTTRTYYIYDQSGRVLSRRVGGLSGVETFVYDGLGRMVSAVDYNGSTTTTSYLDASGTTVVRQANGLNQVSVFNRAGERISYTESDRGENLINAQGWPQGATPSGAATVPGWSNPAAYVAETQWASVVGPDGRLINAIQAGQTVNTQNGGGNFTNAAALDASKAYEFVYYFRKAETDWHSVYFGPSVASVDNATSGAANPNAYFFYASAAQQQALGLNEDRWYKVVGYILPQGSAAVPEYSLGGVYDTTTGQKVASTNVFRWNATSGATVSSRFFDFYDENQIGFSTYFGQPEMRIVPQDAINDLIPATGTRYRYDARGNLRLQIDPTGLQIHLLYDRLGRKVAEIDGDGSLVEYKYDENDRVLATVRYATRLSAAQLASLTDASGNPTGVELAAVRPSTTVDDSWSWSVYDSAGRVVRTINSEGQATSFVYDGASRLLSQTGHATRVASSDLASFRASGAATATALAGSTADRISRYFHDANGRQIGALDAEGYLSQITYDSSGRVTGTLAWSNLTNASLRAAGAFSELQASITANPAKDIRTWSVYDRRGFLRGTVNGEGEVTLYDYDALGGLTQTVRGRKLSVSPVALPTLADLTGAPVPADAFGAPGVLETVAYTRNNYGQVLTETRTVAGGVETLIYSYDSLRRVVGVSTDVAVGSDRTLLQRYDRRGRLIGQLPPEGAAELALLGSGATKAQIDQIYRRWGVTFVYDDADRLIARTDPDGSYGAAGALTLFYYDADGRLTYQINPAGEVVGYKYDALGRMTETREHMSRIVTTGLTGGKAAAIAGLIVNGNSDKRVVFAYNTDDTVRSTTTWVLDSASAPLWYNTVVSTNNTYNAFGEITQRTDEIGTFAAVAAASVTTFAYDKRGQLIQSIQDVGAGRQNLASATTYDAFGRTVTTTDAGGRVRASAYDRAGRTLEITDADNRKTTYAYDARGNTISVTDRMNRTTLFRYTAFNREVRTVSPEGVETLAAYDDRGLKLTLAVDGRVESFSYDRNGNLVTATDGAGAATLYAYDYANRLYEVTDATGRKTRYSYDSANRMLTETQDPGGLNLTTTYVYDGLGQAVRVTDASGVRTDYTFDLMGRTTTTTVDPANLNIRTTIRYDRAGNIESVTEGAGTSAARVTTYTYDTANRRLSQQVGDAALNIRSEYAYDSVGNVTRRRDQIASGAWVETLFAYDAENRLIWTVDPVGAATRTVYDNEGRVIRTLAYADALTAAERTALGAAPTVAAIEGALTADPAQDRSNAFIYDDDGRLIFSVDSIGAVTRNLYDGSGNLLRQTRYASPYTASPSPTEADLVAWAAGQADARVTRAAYDGANRQVFSIDPEGFVTGFVYDGAGRTLRTLQYAVESDAALPASPSAAQVTTWANANSSERDRKTQIVYDSAGRAAYVVDPAGYISRTTYNAAGRVTEQARFGTAFNVADNSTAGAVASLVAGFESTAAKTAYGYDSAGRRITVTDAMGGVTTTQLNALGKAVKITDPRGSVGLFYYDTAGRLTIQVDPEHYWTRTTYRAGETVATVTRGAARLAAAPAVNIAPDLTGLTGATTTFTYDLAGRLTGATDAENKTETYTLNTFGDRTVVTNKLNGSTTYTYDRRGLKIAEVLPITSLQGGAPSAVINQFEYDAFGNMTRSIEAASLVEQRITDYQYDALDRLTAKISPAVTVTSSGTFGTSSAPRTESIAYDGFGNVTQTTTAGGARTLFYYDALGRKTGEIDALGTRRTWIYDSRDNAVSARTYSDRPALPSTAGGVMADPTGPYRETTFVYDKNNRQISSTIAGLWTGSYTPGVGYVLNTTDGVTQSRTYDASGNVTSITDGRGVTSYSFYDALGRQVAAVDGEGYLTSWVRDAEGNVTREVRYAIKVVGAITTTRAINTLAPRNADAAMGDRITDFTYDQNGRRLTETRRGVEVYASPPDADRLTVVDATITYVYDALGNVTRKTEANEDFVDYAYDLLGRQTSATTSAFTDYLGAVVRRETLTTYNGLSAVTRIQDGKQGGLVADARVTTFTYTGDRLTSTTDATGFTRHFGYDVEGRVVRESYDRLRGDGVTVTEGRRYSYDLLGRVVLESSASSDGAWSFGDARGMTYNAFGEIVEKSVNTVVTERFSYDAGGRMWLSTAGDGVVKLFVHDGAGNITLTYASAGLDLTGAVSIADTIGYVMTGGVVDGGTRTDVTATFTRYDGRGLLLGSVEPKRQLSRDLTTGAYTTADIHRSRSYNAFGEVVSETDPRGYVTDFIYNTMGRIIEQRRPEVAYTNEAGVVINARPTEQYRYDISGRLIATRSANGFWTSRTLMAGSGHGDAEAIVTSELTPDNGQKVFGVDVFGDIRKITNQLGHVTLQDFDKAGRLITLTHAARAAGSAGNPGASPVQLVDFYAYDGLGQRIQHWNSQFGATWKEQTVFDREGRVVSQTDLDGLATTYSYAWDQTLATTGLGAFGGWIKTTAHASGKVGVEKFDTFGRLTAKTDLGGRTYAMGFDKGGRQVSQTSSAGQSLLMTWFNTGMLARQSDISGNAQTFSTSNAQADYSYDVANNRVRERYATTEWTYAYDPNTGGWDPYGGTYTPPTATQTTTLRQDGHVTYDAMGRITEFRDTVISSTDPTLTQYTYDLNGNLRSTFTKYWTYDTALSTIPGVTYWYKYDAMNRFTVARGALVDGQIQGEQILYDLAGNRRHIVRGGRILTDIVESSYWEYRPNGVLTQPEDPWDEQGTPPPGYVQVFVYQTRPATIVESFAYTEDGYLASVSQTADVWNSASQTVVSGTTRLFSTDVRDAMGRLISHKEYAQAGEYASGGSTVSNERTTTWSRAGLIQTDTQFTYTNYDGGTGQDYFTTSTTTYDYRAETFPGSGAWTGAWQGVVTRVRTTTSKDMYPSGGSTTNLPTSQTTYQYVWWDSAQQAKITYDSDTGSGDNPIYTSTFGYDVNGRVSFVNIKDGRPRNVTFVTDVNGQVLTRTETDNLTAYDDPWSRYYYFNGVRVGELTNNAPFDPGSYISHVNNRISPPSGGSTSTPFYSGNYGTPSADFDQAYEALTPNSIPGGGQVWTVRTGDTLQGIAAAVWGDSALWYLIADANGLTANSLLTPGQLLTVPAKVANVHNTSDTFRPYDPNKALGDVNPTQPAPPKKPGGCGVVGQIIAVVIAAAVSSITGGVAGAFLGNLVTALNLTGAAATIAGGVASIAGAMVGGAVGSAASQGFLIATGAQDKFDWKTVGISAISAGVSKGLKLTGFKTFADGLAGGNTHLGQGITGATSNAITQGISKATGLRDDFSWNQVAVSGVMAYAGSHFDEMFDVPLDTPVKEWDLADHGRAALSSLSSAMVGAGVQTALEGGNFGDNVVSMIPQAIGQTLGNMIIGNVLTTPAPEVELGALGSTWAAVGDFLGLDGAFGYDGPNGPQGWGRELSLSALGDAIGLRKESQSASASVSVPFDFGLSGLTSDPLLRGMYSDGALSLDLFSIDARFAFDPENPGIISNNINFEKELALDSYITVEDFEYSKNFLTRISLGSGAEALRGRLESAPWERGVTRLRGGNIRIGDAVTLTASMLWEAYRSHQDQRLVESVFAKYGLDRSDATHVLAARAYAYHFQRAFGAGWEREAEAEGTMRAELFSPGLMYRYLRGDRYAYVTSQHFRAAAVEEARFARTRARPAGVDAALQTWSSRARMPYRRWLERNPGKFEVHHLVTAEAWGSFPAFSMIARQAGWRQDGVTNTMLLPADLATQRRYGALPLHEHNDLLARHRGSHGNYNQYVIEKLEARFGNLGGGPIHPQVARAIMDGVAYEMRWEIWMGAWNPRIH